MKKAFLGVSLVALGLVYACGGSGADTGGGGGGDTDGGGGGGNTDGGGGGGGGNEGGGGGGDTDGGGGGNDGGLSGTRAIKTVFIIMMENHSWSSVKAATYIKTLIPMGGHAEAYSTPTGNHPSEPNYLWLESGDNLGITNDNAPSANHQSTKDHLTAQLNTAGVSWKAYVEGIDGKTCPLVDSSTALAFSPKHTPMLFFDDITGTNNKTSQTCIDHIRPYTELATDLAGTTPKYNFITPDLCDDMHGQISGKCNVGSDNVNLGDTWLSTAVPAIMNSAAYKNDGALFIIWDEGDESFGQTASDGPVGMIVLSPLAKPGFSSSTAFTHSSTLRTMEEIFSVPLLRDAQKATDLSEFFTKF